MEGLVCILVLAVLIVPIVMLWKLFAIGNSIEKLRKTTDNISKRLNALEQLSRSMDSDIVPNELAEEAQPAVQPEAEHLPECEPLPWSRQSIPPEDVLPEEVLTHLAMSAVTPPPVPEHLKEESSSQPQPAPFTEPKQKPRRKQKRRNFEKLIGENLLGKIGILALVIGMGFFVKYAIDNNWLNETGRTVLGLMVGCGLWVIAWFLRDRYRSFASVLSGGGFAVCFVTVAIAYNFYHIFSPTASFAIYVCLTAFMIFIALRFNRRELASVGFIGGFMAPFLCISDSGNFIMLFGYIAVLNVGMAIITVRRKWWELAAIGCLLTWIIVFIQYATEGLTFEIAAWTLGYITFFVMLFSLPLATVLRHDRRQSWLGMVLILTSAINFVAYLIIGLDYIDHIPVLKNLEGIIPFIPASICATLIGICYRGPADMMMRDLLLGAAIFFFIIIFPIQFSRPWIVTLCFGALAVAFTGVYARRGNKLFGAAAIIMAFIVALRLAEAAAWPSLEKIPAGVPPTFLICGICYSAMAFIIHRYILTRPESDTVSMLWSYRCALWGGIVVMCVSAYLWVGRTAGSIMAMNALMTASMAALLLISLIDRRSDDAGWLFPGIGALMFLVYFATSLSKPTALNQLLEWSAAAMYIAVLAIQGRRIFTGHAAMGIFGRSGFAVYYSLAASLFVIIALEMMLYSADLTRYYSAGFSLGLIVCGALTMVAGMRYRSTVVRFVSLALFGILLLKLVAYDLWQLPIVGRIAVLILLGAVLLVISFSYQRLRKTLFPPKE